MMSVLTSSPEYGGFDTWMDETKDYIIGFFCISDNIKVLREKRKDGLTRMQHNVTIWSVMSPVVDSRSTMIT